MLEFDYIIIGAGSAGCVLANRLGANLSKRILIVEAGPMDYDPMIHLPAGVHKAWKKPRINWNYETEPQPELFDQSIFMPRGKVVGGSSSINSMVYMRGHPADYDAWANDFGLQDWAYDKCLPYFKAGETYAEGEDEFRGGSGPLGTCKSSYQNPLYDAFIEAGIQAGQGYTKDANGAQPEGVTRYDATKRNGRRCSAAIAHLRPALRRGNVKLLTNAAVRQILFDGSRSTGISFLRKGREQSAYASEIILSGGAINSPQLLMSNGIGPAEQLAKVGVDQRVNLPGVGQNLMDHATIILQYECLKPFPIHRVDKIWNKAAAGARWVFFRDGAAASNIWEVGGLVKSSADEALPDLQYHFAPVGFEYIGDRISLSQAFAIHTDLSRPYSRGWIELVSPDPAIKPKLHFNYLSHPLDVMRHVEGIKRTRELIAQPAFDGLRGKEKGPTEGAKTDAELETRLRKALDTDFHPCGTCKMGHGDDAVVDDHFQVHGVEGLRVVDASIMPRITSANLNAPVQMIAARAADIISCND